ncbi:MAG: MFS transporter [Candidatus Hermodarchaeota archaeon]
MEQQIDKKTYRNYLFFWSGQLFSIFGSSVVFFAIIWWIAVVYDSEMFLSIATFLQILPMTIFLPIAGVFADRLNRKTLILVVDSLQAFFTFILIFFFQFDVVNIGIIFLFISLRSICQAFHVPTVNAIIPSMVPEDNLTRINAINFIFTGAIQILAPLIGSILLVIFNENLAQILWVDIITFIIALIPLILITIPSVKEKEVKMEKKSFIREFRLGIRVIRVIPGLFTLILIGMFINFLIRPLATQLPLYVTRIHDGTTTHYAFILAILHGGMVLGALVASIKKNWSHKIRIIFLSTIITMGGYLIIALAPKGLFYIIFIGAIIMGFCLPLINSLFQTFMQTVVPKDKLGRVTSFDWFLSNLISPVGALISGPLVVVFGIQYLFLYSAIFGLIIPVSIWSLTKIRKLDYDSKTELEKITNEINNIDN